MGRSAIAVKPKKDAWKTANASVCGTGVPNGRTASTAVGALHREVAEHRDKVRLCCRRNLKDESFKVMSQAGIRVYVLGTIIPSTFLRIMRMC